MILFGFLLIISFTNATYLYFEHHSYEISISESTETLTRIISIQAIFSPSLSIQYELHGDTNHTFHLNSLTGQLILLNHLDYETIPIYKLTIEARSTTAFIAPIFSELILHILNINDNLPEINLIIHPSVFYNSHTIKYDLNTSSTPFATINIKDLDQSTTNLSLTMNDTEHFQIQLIRQMNNILIYLLSTKNNAHLIDQDDFYLSLNSCDNDRPSLCTNQTYKFQLRSSEYLCNLSFNQKTYLIDMKENLLEKTLLLAKIPNQFCETVIYSIDDPENFYIDPQTGELFTSKYFNRTERSIYIIYLLINHTVKIKIIIRLLDEDGHLPFLLKKKLIINSKQFSSVHLFNSTFCRAQFFLENYFQLFSNCTIIPLIQPPKGRYLFHIQLNQQMTYHDTFVLELEEQQQQRQWIIIIPVLLGVLIVVGILIIIKRKSYRFDQQNSRTSPLSFDDKRYETLKVRDDQQISSSPRSTAIYLIEKPSPSLSNFSPTRDDEGYSGSSDVSDTHPPFETTIISANELLEQYRIHDFHHHSTSLYDIPTHDMSLV